MHVLTQGTIITGMRSRKYKNINCSGIVISARCDLANYKVTKIYYLTAVSVDDWLISDEGFSEALSSRISSLESNLQNKLEKAGLDWNTLKEFTEDDFRTVVTDGDVGLKKDAEKSIDDFITYKKYVSSSLPILERKELLKQQQKSVTDYLLKIANGTVMHYAYIPEDAYWENSCIHKGLIVDLQELESISLKAAETLSKCEMDIKSSSLTVEEIENYDIQFYLKNPPGYALAECDVRSSWIEYLMQRFSNSFIRIGVDSLTKEHIQTIFDRMT